MAHKIVPYILPIATLLAITIILLFARPAITGLFIAPQKQVLEAEIRITADEVLPEDAIINAYIKTGNTSIEIFKMSTKDFISKYPEAMNNFSYQQGRNNQLNYEGSGYTGGYVLNIGNLDVENMEKGIYTLKTEIIWQGKVVSETTQEIVF
jgi:hypothetical protein